MDDRGNEIADGGFFARDGVIETVGTSADLPRTADTVLDMAGHAVIPGLVNTHHHMFQSLTRVVPGGQDARLFGWLTSCYPIWQRLGPEHIHCSALTAMAEMILSGCTTSSDHLYLFPNGARLEDEIEAADEIGIRFHAMRGSMSKGQSKGGLPPDSLVEDEGLVLKDSRRVIEAWHDPRPFSMLHVGLAPCTPFTVSEDLMRETAELARSYRVRLHTHTAENGEDVAYCKERFGLRPVEYAERLGWTGADTWHAHCVELNKAEIKRFASSHTGVAHCPCSNMRLASGIAPVRAMIDARVPVGLGVDGSASSDSGHLLNEARQAMLLQRVGGDPGALSAREALRLATRGGAEVLGRALEIGQLTPGYAADFAAYDLNQIELAGAAQFDPVAALVFCGPVKASHVGINGRIVVKDGRLATLDLPRHIERHGQLARELAIG
jgi:cytosine/adenosine deaminase-related metal-dependent hydrolase